MRSPKSDRGISSLAGPAQCAISDCRTLRISLGEPHDPRLQADSLDIAILVQMYHEIAQPYALLYNLVSGT